MFRVDKFYPNRTDKDYDYSDFDQEANEMIEKHFQSCVKGVKQCDKKFQITASAAAVGGGIRRLKYYIWGDSNEACTWKLQNANNKGPHRALRRREPFGYGFGGTSTSSQVSIESASTKSSYYPGGASQGK